MVIYLIIIHYYLIVKYYIIYVTRHMLLVEKLQTSPALIGQSGEVRSAGQPPGVGRSDDIARTNPNKLHTQHPRAMATRPAARGALLARRHFLVAHSNGSSRTILCTTAASNSSTRPISSTACRCRQLPPQHDPYEQLRQARPLVTNRPKPSHEHYTTEPPPRSSRLFVAGCVGAAVAFYVLNTQTVPVTGRRRFNFLSDEVVIFSQGDAVSGVIAQVQEQGSSVLPDNDSRTRLVKRVLNRLIPVSGLKDLNWEIFVIDDDSEFFFTRHLLWKLADEGVTDTANAFVLPGGKVFVFSGILKLARTEAGVAAVLGHEIAHNVASHAAERLSLVSTGYLTGGCLFFLSGIWTGLTLFGAWAFVGGYYLQELLLFLPADRKQEHEADCIGLMMMAEACYDPQAAIGFWQRMEAMSKAGGQEVPEMLSTHPSVS